MSNHLADLHLFAALDHQVVVVGIGRDPAPVMLNQKQIAEPSQFASRIGDHAVIGGANCGPSRCGDIDPVSPGPAGPNLESILPVTGQANRLEARAGGAEIGGITSTRAVSGGDAGSPRCCGGDCDG